MRKTYEIKGQGSSPVTIKSSVKTSDGSTDEKITATQMANYSRSSSSRLISVTSSAPKQTDTLFTKATTTQKQGQAMLSSLTMITPKSSIGMENTDGSPLTVMPLKNTKVETIVTSATETSILSSEKEKSILQHTSSVIPRLSKMHASYSLVIGPEKRETINVVAQFRRTRNVSVPVTSSEIKTSAITREVPKSRTLSSQESTQNLGSAAETTKYKEASTVIDLKSDKVHPSLSTEFYHDFSSKQGQDNTTQTAESKSAVLVSSASLKSTRSYQSRISVVKSTRVDETNSLALPVHVISKSEHVTTILKSSPILHSHVSSSSKRMSLSSKPERIMPSKASEKATEIVSSGARTVPATTSATKEPHGNDTTVVSAITTPSKGEINMSFFLDLFSICFLRAVFKWLSKVIT